MCGHVGIAGKLEFKDEATMKRLLLYDFFRGPDSTGFAALRNNGDTHVAKIASHPLDLFDSKRFNTALSGHNSTIFLGHNRLATKGVINHTNAHPYEFDHIIGAHNGTLEKASWDAIEEAVGEKFDVDSMAIVAGIAKLGIEKVAPLLQGAWALVWIDKKENTLNFLRNKERSFWFSYTKNFDRLFWASEYPIIESAVKMSLQGYELHTDPEKGYRFWQTEENWWYRFDIDLLKKGGTEKPKPKVKELKGKEPTPVVSYTGGVHPFHQRQTQTEEAGKKNSTTTFHGGTPTSTSRTALATSHVTHLKGTTAQPYGGFLTKEAFDEIAKYGCAWCSCDVDFEEVGAQVYQNPEPGCVLCPSCAHENEVSKVYVGPNVLVG